MRYGLILFADKEKLTNEESRKVFSDSSFYLPAAPCDIGGSRLCDAVRDAIKAVRESDGEKRAVVITDSVEIAGVCDSINEAHLFYDPKGRTRGHKYILMSIFGLYLDDGGLDGKYLDEVYARTKGLPLTILETERTYLREISKVGVRDDVRALAKIYEKEHVTDYLEGLYPFDEEVEYEKKYIDNIYGFYGYGMWLVCLKAADEVIGRAGIETRSGMEDDTVELGYLIDPQYQGRGIATEVCGAIVEYAVRTLKKTRIVSRVHPKNKASVALMKRLEFVPAAPRPAEADAVGEDIFFERRFGAQWAGVKPPA